MSQLLQYYKSFQTPKSNNNTPTFEDLSIDDDLSELERVVRYVKSSIGLQRLVHVKMLSNVAMSVGFEMTNTHIVPVLEQLSVDLESAIRSHLCEQMIGLAKFIEETGGDDGYQVILDVFLPIIGQLLGDSKAEVRQAASVALVAVAQIIRPQDLGQHVLTIILQLAHEDENEEMRMTASELLNLLAEHLGLDLCQQFVIPEVVSLAEDPVFRVRKSTALNFENVCKVGGEHELFERLMPAFVRLSKDDMYRVRRACAENLCEISKHVSDDIRAGVLVEIFLRLAQDPSKLVKQSILQQSGMFISTLPPKVISAVILGHYCSMINNPTGDISVDADLKHHCAFSFPGVLQTVGRDRWGELREVYHSLVQSQNTKIRETLAMSLHEVARILGEKLAEEELVAVFEDIIQDVQECVRLGILKHLAEFLRLLSMPCRVSYLPLLDDILQSTSPFNWRFRRSLAAQIPELVSLPPPENVFSTLFPLAMTLLQDPVADVRIEAFNGISKMLMVLQPGGMNNVMHEGLESDVHIKMCPSQSDSERYLDSIARAINALVYGETFLHRCLWAELSLQLLRDLPQQLFEKYFIDGIVKLTGDSVSNVRICVAQLLTGWDPLHSSPFVADITPEKCPWVWLLEKEEIKDCFRRLAKDDNDVYIAVVKAKPLFPDIEFEAISCRGLKVAPSELSPNSLLAGRKVINDRNEYIDESINTSGIARIPDIGSIPTNFAPSDDYSISSGASAGCDEYLPGENQAFALLSLTETERESLGDAHVLKQYIVDEIDEESNKAIIVTQHSEAKHEVQGNPNIDERGGEEECQVQDNPNIDERGGEEECQVQDNQNIDEGIREEEYKTVFEGSVDIKESQSLGDDVLIQHEHQKKEDTIMKKKADDGNSITVDGIDAHNNESSNKQNDVMKKCPVLGKTLDVVDDIAIIKPSELERSSERYNSNDEGVTMENGIAQCDNDAISESQRHESDSQVEGMEK